MRFPEFYCFVGLQKINSSDRIFQFVQSKRCQISTHLFRYKVEEVFNVFRLTGKEFSQFRILSCNTYRTGIAVTLTHHQATETNQNCSGKTKLFRTKQCTDNHITPGFQLAINLKPNPVTQHIQSQRLLGFCQSQFPWQTNVFDTG